MINKKTKLNLGCGYVYKPGYINIDKFDDTVADKICDIVDLPFEPNSVDLIEASQLIEHFDYIHCKYILSECFRTLKPDGELILETPDLKKTFKKFIRTDLETQKTTLQWIYGIDSSGMQHKTGFTFNLLNALLKEIGFTELLSEEPETHRYEPGMRIVGKKPIKYLKKQLFACFRKSIIDEFKISDSFLLIPLETWLQKIFESYEESGKDKESTTNKIISKTVMGNPQIPLMFFNECIKCGLLKESEIADKIGLLDFLIKIEFHKKVFSLWSKSKKDIGRLDHESKKFMFNLESSIAQILREQLDYEERLKYILNLEPTDIFFFDFSLVFLESKKLFNIGVKQFYKEDFNDALKTFLESSKLNPDNALIYWNMARLECILKIEKHNIIANYEKALRLIKSRKNRKKIEAELRYVKDNKSDLISKEPLSEDYQIT